MSELAGIIGGASLIFLMLMFLVYMVRSIFGRPTVIRMEVGGSDCDICRGKCCVGQIEVFPTDMIYTDDSLTMELKNCDYDRVMITDKDNRCISLSGGRCLIYTKRPSICREFKVGSECCVQFKSGEMTKHVCMPCELVMKRKEENE